MKDRYLGTDVYIEEGELKNVRLLQSSLAKLSTFKCNEGTIKSITNCSFFNSKFVLGRNIGDEKNDTYADQDNLKYADVVIFKNGTYEYGYMNNYDYRDNVVCGFSSGAILVYQGVDVEMYSSPITDIENIINTKSQRTAFAITKDKKAIQFVSEGRTKDDKGLTGFEVRDYLKSKYEIEMLAILDGGGSSELIVEGKIQNVLGDGKERPMLNGVAFLGQAEEIKLLYPCASGGDAQGFIPNKHYGLDFGWIKNESDDILACADGEVTFEGFYNDAINGVTYRTIGVILKHEQFSKDYDYYSLYTHLAATTCDKGQLVKKGDKIGVKGNSGYSFGKHLHFQFMKVPKGQSLNNWNKNAIDPTNYLYREEWQIFKYQGCFDIPLEVEEKPIDNNELETKISDLEKENTSLIERLKQIENERNKALNDVQKLKSLIKEVLERLQDYE